MNVKKMRWMVLAGILFLASCGGGGGGGSAAEAAAEASIDAFLSIMMSGDLQPCLNCDNGPITCDCPGGGNIVISAGCADVTVTNCKSSDGKTFAGTITYDNDVLNINLTSFGECSNMMGSNIPLVGDCSGTVSGTCAGVSLTCNVVDDPDDPEECDLSC